MMGLKQWEEEIPNWDTLYRWQAKVILHEIYMDLATYPAFGGKILKDGCDALQAIKDEMVEELLMNRKYKALDAIQSLVTTAITWTRLEFPVPNEGVEQQTINEILNDLNKSKVALDNLIVLNKDNIQAYFTEIAQKTLFHSQNMDLF